ncbi:hypothetical protein PRA96_24710, partial [Klebsiella pneumoniae]|nr:hypothetical protein [Klebsiella pneumoniae]MEE2218566.1 hypothetical protein [Klebsiella pneumoniae]MEE2229351.1 hypothetical protein [Klebsiella pneumoniae]MEE2261618.1 hypothetical protein [Klebsiella pneumoniae]
VGHLFMFLVGGKTPDQSVHLNLTTTLIVEGFKAQEEALPAAALRTLALLQAELPLKKAAALAAEIHGVKKNALYKYALEQQGE